MEQARFVGEDHACHYRTRLAVDDTTDGLDGTFLVVDGIVVQTQPLAAGMFFSASSMLPYWRVRASNWFSVMEK